MTSEILLSALRNEPFLPFKIRLVNGHAVPVDHPDIVTCDPDGSTAAVMKAGESREIINLAAIVSLEFDPPGETK
jgi:hypothetical protein